MRLYWWTALILHFGPISTNISDFEKRNCLSRKNFNLSWTLQTIVNRDFPNLSVSVNRSSLIWKVIDFNLSFYFHIFSSLFTPILPMENKVPEPMVGNWYEMSLHCTGDSIANCILSMNFSKVGISNFIQFMYSNSSYTEQLAPITYVLMHGSFVASKLLSRLYCRRSSQKIHTRTHQLKC